MCFHEWPTWQMAMAADGVVSWTWTRFYSSILQMSKKLKIPLLWGIQLLAARGYKCVGNWDG
jgi:hypothetical protein